MTGTEIILMYVPLYLARNILTLINFIRKTKKGELKEVTEITTEMAIEQTKRKGWQLVLSTFEILWGIIGFFTPFAGLFIGIGINNLIRVWISVKAPREKAGQLFLVNSLIQIALISYLLYKIQTEYALFY